MIPTEPYEVILDKYYSTIDWMENNGVKLDSGRTSHYERIISYWTNNYRTATAEEGMRKFPDFVSSMFEIHDFVKVYEAFKDVEPSRLSGIVDVLKKGVKGPLNLHEETEVTTKARNFLYEAVVAAKLHHPELGATVIFDADSDTGVSFQDHSIWVECKRVTSKSNLEANVRKASKQLEQVMDKQVGCKHRGIIALDFSKIINPKGYISVLDNDEHLVDSMDRLIRDLIDEFSAIWERVYARRSKRIIGTILSVGFMSTSKERNLLVYTSEWGLNPRSGIDDTDRELQKELVSIMESVPER